MAFPAVAARTETNGTTAGTTVTVNTGSPANGDLCVIIHRAAGVGAIGWPAGWTELIEDSSDASDDVTAIAYRQCDGTEGATISVTQGNFKFASIAIRVTGHELPATQPPQLSPIAIGSSTTPDPNDLTPTGGAKDYLVLWLGAWEGEQTSPPTGTPTGYALATGASSGTAGNADTNCRVALASANINAATITPGSWTISATDQWSAWIMGVHPAGVASVFLLGERARRLRRVRMAS